MRACMDTQHRNTLYMLTSLITIHVVIACRAIWRAASWHTGSRSSALSSGIQKPGVVILMAASITEL